RPVIGDDSTPQIAPLRPPFALRRTDESGIEAADVVARLFPILGRRREPEDSLDRAPKVIGPYRLTARVSNAAADAEGKPPPTVGRLGQRRCEIRNEPVAREPTDAAVPDQPPLPAARNLPP